MMLGDVLLGTCTHSKRSRALTVVGLAARLELRSLRIPKLPSGSPSLRNYPCSVDDSESAQKKTKGGNDTCANTEAKNLNSVKVCWCHICRKVLSVILLVATVTSLPTKQHFERLARKSLASFLRSGEDIWLWPTQEQLELQILGLWCSLRHREFWGF